MIILEFFLFPHTYLALIEIKIVFVEAADDAAVVLSTPLKNLSSTLISSCYRHKKRQRVRPGKSIKNTLPVLYNLLLKLNVAYANNKTRNVQKLNDIVWKSLDFMLTNIIEIFFSMFWINFVRFNCIQFFLLIDFTSHSLWKQF